MAISKFWIFCEIEILKRENKYFFGHSEKNEKCFFVDLLVFIKYSFRQHDERHLAMFGYREARASAVSTS